MQPSVLELDIDAVSPAGETAELQVAIWRNEVTTALLQVLLIIGSLAILASPIWSYEQDNVLGLAAATGLFVAVSVAMFFARKRLHFNAGVLLVACYLSMASLLMCGMPRELPFLLFFMTVGISAYVVNQRLTAAWCIAGIVVVAVVNAVYWLFALAPADRPQISVAWWVAWLVSFVLVSLVVALPQRRLVDRILRVLEQTQRDKRTLAASENRFLTIFNSVSDAIFIVEIDTGRILEVNDAMCRMWDCTREFAMSVTSIDQLSLGDPPYSHTEATRWMRLAATGEPCHFEWYARDTKGRTFWTEMSIHRARIGEHDRLVVTARSINERVRAQQALQRQLVVQDMAIRFSARVLSSSIEAFDAAIDELLGEAGRHFGVQAASIARLDPDGMHYQLSHLWMIEGYPRFFDFHEPTPMSSMPLLQRLFMAGEPRRLNDLSDVPAEHQSELELLRRKGIKAVLAAPLRGGGNDVIGCLSICMLVGPRVWTDEEEGQMRLLASVLAAATNGHRSQEALKTSEERYRQTAEFNERLLAEVNHRVRNNLASILGLLTLSADTDRDVKAYVDTLRSRIGAMARTHDVLSQSKWQPVKLAKLAGQLHSLFVGENTDGQRVVIEGPDVLIQPELAGSLALALQELLTNAHKHGALRDDRGSVHLSWSIEGAKLRIVWRETCSRMIIKPTLRGTGLELLEGLVRYDLQGDLLADFTETGLVCTITFPLKRA